MIPLRCLQRGFSVHRSPSVGWLMSRGGTLVIACAGCGGEYEMGVRGKLWITPRGCNNGTANGSTERRLTVSATLKLTHKAIGAEVRRGTFDVLVDGKRVGSSAMAETRAELRPSMPPRAKLSPSDAPARGFCPSFSRPSSFPAWRSSSIGSNQRCVSADYRRARERYCGTALLRYCVRAACRERQEGAVQRGWVDRGVLRGVPDSVDLSPVGIISRASANGVRQQRTAATVSSTGTALGVIG